MRSNFTEAYIRHVAPSLDKQLHLSKVIGDHDWHFDLGADLITFSDQHRWHVQLLGTTSASSGTWQWAWASTPNIPGQLLVASHVLRALAEQRGIPELASPRLSLDRIGGHTFALLASGICEANAYYRCPYEGGALYVLIMDENFPQCTDPPLQRVATVFPQAIASLDIPDHKLALTGYLDHHGLAYEQDGEKLVVKENGESVLTATFDEQNRLTNLEVQLEAQADEPAKSDPVESWDEMQLRRMLGG